jgi:prepilin-type N-terminal cleavage/methylation domain-containing protein
MGRRGFTLLEILLVLAVAAIMASLAIPAVWGRMDGAQLRAAATQVESAVLSVRSSAQREGRALALYAAQDGERVRLRREEFDPTPDDAAGGSSVAARDRQGAAGVKWLGILPAGVHVTTPVAAADDTDEIARLVAGDSGERGGRSARATPAAAEPIRLVVALPDGSMIAPAPLRISRARADEDPSTRPGLLLSINRWTGVCTVSPAPREDESEQALAGRAR